MAEFNMGYPKRCGDDSQDLKNLYNFVCEMSDRLADSFRVIEQTNNKSNTTTEATAE